MTCAWKCRHCGVTVVFAGGLWWHATNEGNWRACRDKNSRMLGTTMAEPEDEK